MPYKDIEQRRRHNREARHKEYEELKELRGKVSKCLELIQSAPLPESETLKELEKILLA